jgi:hypothetical protein
VSGNWEKKSVAFMVKLFSLLLCNCANRLNLFFTVQFKN